jgi:hypothetical protein
MEKGEHLMKDNEPPSDPFCDPRLFIALKMDCNGWNIYKYIIYSHRAAKSCKHASFPYFGFSHENFTMFKVKKIPTVI